MKKSHIQPKFRLLSIEDVADRTGLSVWTWRRWVSVRTVRSYKVGRRRMIAESDLNQFLSECAVEADPRLTLAPGQRDRR